MCHLIICPPGNGFNLPCNMEIYSHYHGIKLNSPHFSVGYYHNGGYAWVQFVPMSVSLLISKISTIQISIKFGRRKQ